MIKLKNGKEVSVEEFASWSATKQHMNLVGLSDEAKLRGAAKSSQKLKGRVFTEEQKAAISKGRIGVKVSVPQTEQAKQNRSKGQLGKKRVKTPEQIAKHKAAITGKKRGPQSEETKAKMRATWAAKRAAKLAVADTD